MGSHGMGPQGAGLHGAGLHGAGLHGAGLHGAGLHGAGLHGAGLQGAGPHGVGPHGVGSQGAGPHGVGSQGAGPHGVGSQGAGLQGAGLQGAGLQGAGPASSSAGAAADAGLGLPGHVRACLFDLDGVITRTAVVHARAWKNTFDTFLASWADRQGQPFVPFDLDQDYGLYVDGRPRLDGTRTFLGSRGIVLPEGTAGDPPGTPTVQGLSNAKNTEVLRRIRADGVEVYPDTLAFLHAVRNAGLGTAVVSSSVNTVAVLHVTGLTDLFDARIDGVVARERRLAGKPAPDTFLAGAAELGVPAGQAAVFEDALSGVEAGHAGGFAVVVGVDRVGHGEALLAHGADVVVTTLTRLLDRQEDR
jgi:beta-phosphoglucomutase family hydrolase